MPSEIITGICNNTISDFQLLQKTSPLFTPTMWLILITMFLLFVLYFSATGFRSKDGRWKPNILQPHVIIALILVFGIASAIVVLTMYVPVVSQLLNKIFI